MRSDFAAERIRSHVRTGNVATVIDATARQASETLRQQAAAISALAKRVDERFTQAIRVLSAIDGHVIVTGLGKSGHVGRKMAATFASTGTPSFFVHATEALHGDLGMITRHDAVLLISYSGETAELLQLLPHLRARGVTTVALVGVPTSTLAREVDIALDVSVDREVCPHNLAPTSSTLAALAMGDTLAISLMRLRAFREEDFAKLHPGGGLGRRLMRASDAAVREGVVALSPDLPLAECVLSMAASDLGVALVQDEYGELLGMITPVELQHALTRMEGAMRAPLRELMRTDVPTVAGETLLGDAEAAMEREDLPALVVLGSEGELLGILPRPRRK